MLPPGVYTFRASEEVALVGDVQGLGIGQGFFNFSFDLSKIGDLDGDGTVGVGDLLLLLAAWGPCADCDTPQACPADLDDDCTVGIGDLLILFANWG